MRWGLLSVLLLAGTFSEVGAACIDPATLVTSTVSIARQFGKDERGAASGIAGIRGTGWFLSGQSIVTAGHVAEAMHLSEQDWKEIEIRERDHRESIATRIVRIVGSRSEKMAVLELRAPFRDATALKLRTQPMTPEERLVSLAYPNGELRFATGRFARYGIDGGFAGAALLEMHAGNDRLVLDHGASGAPVLDCEGRVVAVVSTLITQTINLPTGAVRVSTAWQTPNVLSIPAVALRDFSWSE